MGFSDAQFYKLRNELGLSDSTEGHPLHRGHSLSVSDIVVTKDGAYYCDSVGFLKVDFDEAKTQKPDNLMTVVYVEPHKAPYVTEIAHTLEAE